MKTFSEWLKEASTFNVANFDNLPSYVARNRIDRRGVGSLSEPLRTNTSYYKPKKSSASTEISQSARALFQRADQPEPKPEPKPEPRPDNLKWITGVGWVAFPTDNAINFGYGPPSIPKDTTVPHRYDRVRVLNSKVQPATTIGKLDCRGIGWSVQYPDKQGEFHHKNKLGDEGEYLGKDLESMNIKYNAALQCWDIRIKRPSAKRKSSGDPIRVLFGGGSFRDGVLGRKGIGWTVVYPDGTHLYIGRDESKLTRSKDDKRWQIRL